MKEGGLRAPKRDPIPWEDPDFYDEAAFEKELRRVADICHTCRRCFNLCTSFPKLFDAIDASKTGEVDSLSREDFQPSIDACTLCDMCFMVSCPYVPPHPFNIDFPHLILRARAIAARKKKIPFTQNQLTKTDRNGCVGCRASGVANWVTKTSNSLTRPVMEKVAGIHKEAHLPKFNKKPFHQHATPLPPNPKAPNFGAQAALFTTCFVSYNDAAIGEAALKVLAHNGVDVALYYKQCCGMPRWELGLIKEVADTARAAKADLLSLIEQGKTIISLVPSCTLMLTKEWPLLHPDDGDFKTIATHTMDIATYINTLATKNGLTPGLKPLDDGVTLHIACHARAQNNGRQAQTMMKQLPETPLKTIERCSGHGGSWGVMKENFQDALKVGKPVMRAIQKENTGVVASECPLAAAHLKQGTEKLDTATKTQKDPPARAQAEFLHPIQVMAKAYGLA